LWKTSEPKSICDEAKRLEGSGEAQRQIVDPLVCFEVDRNLRLDFDGFAIEVVRLVSPLVDSFQRGARENGVSTEHFQIGDVALFVDGCFDLHCALGTNRERGWGIFWLHPLDQQSLGHALGNSYCCQRRPGNT